MAKQKLTPTAMRMKAARDKKAAMSAWGKYKKRTAQKRKCPPGFDFDHSCGKCISKKKNRAKNSRSGKVKKRYGF